jgi:hypothetical protein
MASIICLFLLNWLLKRKRKSKSYPRNRPWRPIGSWEFHRVDLVPDPLLLGKCGSTDDGTRVSGSVAKNSDYCPHLRRKKKTKKQIQFPKHCVLYWFRIPNDGQGI